MQISSSELGSALWITSTLQEHMALFGYERHDTPVVDIADLFLAKSGDVAMSKLVSFEHRGLQLALRPEFTAGAAHSYVATISKGNEVKRWQFAGYVFEDHDYSSVQHYQRFSIGAEMLGLGGPYADAEVIAMAFQGLKRLGLDGVRLRIGHVGLMRTLLSRFGLDSRTEHFLFSSIPVLRDPAKGFSAVVDAFEKLVQAKVFSDDGLLMVDEHVQNADVQNMVDMMLGVMQRSPTMGGRTREDIARRLVSKYERASHREQVIAALQFLESWIGLSGSVEDMFFALGDVVGDDSDAQSVLSDWKRAMSFLALHGVSLDDVILSPSLLRSLDYYTGLVFDFVSADDRLLGGGGRYDGLVSLLGDSYIIPAVGFAYYVDAFLGEMLVVDPIVSLVVDDYTKYKTAITWSKALRDNGVSVRILPESPSSGLVLHLREDYVHFSGEDFTLEQLSALTSQMKQVQHE